MVYDIILVLILILCVVLGVKRGAARSLSGLISSFLAYTGATFLGKWISGLIYQNILRSTIHDIVVNS
ncbi:MAG: CvpA family protein, partial [Ruminococcus sp.]|nr:CvpA family protein [Ruminococcus sp.]